MKRLVIVCILLLLISVSIGSEAHEGMLALYADVEQGSCAKELGILETTNIHLFYVKGDGPTIGNAYEFRLVKSSEGVMFTSLSYPLSAQPCTILGDLESGTAIIRNAGTKLEDLCDDSQMEIHLATISIINLSDADSFMVTVKEYPGPEYPPGPRITGCEEYVVIYDVGGGSFVFNGTCYEPLDPFGLVATENTSWGAVKSMYRE